MYAGHAERWGSASGLGGEEATGSGADALIELGGE